MDTGWIRLSGINAHPKMIQVRGAPAAKIQVRPIWNDNNKFLKELVKVMITKLIKLRTILGPLQIWIFKIFLNHGQGNDKKVVKLRAILEDLQSCIFKIFFNHGEGSIEVISQIEGHSGASSNVYFQNFLQPWWR